MSEIRVALRYAKSLVGLAQEKGLLEEVNRDMELFEKVGRENKAFLLMLSNPIIPSDKKMAILKTLFKGRVSDLTIAIFEISVKKKREAILNTVAKEVHNLYNKIKGVEKALVISAVPLTPQLRDKFIEITKSHFKKEIELHEKVDKDLLGGYILKVGDYQVDESLRTKLQDLKVQFSYNPYVKEF